MGETINMETAEGTPGAVEPPAQPTSEPEATTSAVDEESLKAILEPLVQAEVERRTQSVKDKRIAKQESRIDSLEDTLTQLKVLKDDGMSERQAIQYMKMEELIASQGREVPDVVPPKEEPAVQPKVAADDYLSPILKLAKLDANDPEVITILRDERDPAKQLIAIGSLAENRKVISPPVPANVLPSGSGQAVGSDTLESVIAELEAEIAKPVTPATRTRIKELRLKSKELLPKK